MPHDVEVRKTVTVIFTDVTEWTSLGEGLDPETLRHIMARYFDVMRGVIERHGGLVEKFIGDAVMAVFGIPTVREDDALRAVRAAAEMRSSLDALNVGLERDHGVTIQIRTGVNTGEVVVGLELSDVLATGEPVTVAARLEQTASPGEILIGQSTYRLVRDAVEAQNAGPVDLKGKSVPVTAWRLLRVISDLPGVARPFTSPLIGREAELALLHEGLAEAAENRTCRAVTVVAEAGVGKTRLMAEFASSLDEGTLMTRGRCLPYGEGITFWPVVEVVRQLAGITTDDGIDPAREKIAAVMTGDPDTASITEHIAAVMGLSEVAYPVQETFWAIRRFLEAAAGTHPLVIAFDDIHWGETTFLDLLEYLWGWSITAPILILCSARPELLDRRGGWNGATARTVRLDPLSRDESATVIENLLAGGDLDAAVRGHIFDVSEGNPLFVEEVFRMLADEHLLSSAEAGTVPMQDLRVLGIPPTINAVLDARLAALPDTELAVLQRASVMGRLFSWTAMAELTPVDDQPGVGRLLQSLVRRGLIHPDRPEFAGEDGFAFSHVLVRDAAYRSVPKETRAGLHQRFARWVEERAGGDTGAYEEIIGYHLEQAFRHLSELGTVGDSDRLLARRGANYLFSAGRRALIRNDVPATINLMSRAVELLDDDDELCLEIMPDLAEALGDAGDLDRARQVLAQLKSQSESTGDPGLRAHAVLQSWLVLGEADDEDLPTTRREAEHAYDLFAVSGDERGMCRALRVLGDLDYRAGQIASRGRRMERALVHARNAGDVRQLYWIYFVLCVDLNLGPTPAMDAIRRCEQLLAEEGAHRGVAGACFHALAHLRAMTGEIEEAWSLATRFRDILWADGAIGDYLFFAEVPFNIKMLAGEPEEAIAILSEANERIEQLGGEPDLMLMAMLSQALYVTGRRREAQVNAERALACTMPMSQRLAQSVLAMVMATEGELVEAERLAREAVAFFDGSDLLLDHAMCVMNLAEVLRLAGRAEDAASTADEAIGLYDRKGDVMSARNARRFKRQLTAPA